MKRIISILLFTLFSIVLFAQGDTIPTSGFETIHSPYWKVYTVDEDSTIWIYGGSKYGWTELVPDRKYQKHLLDSLNPHKVSLEQARQIDSVFSGDVYHSGYGIEEIGYIVSDTTYLPTGEEVTGTGYWDEENLTFSEVLKNGVIYQRGTEVFVLVKNQTGVTISDGMPVKYAGSIGASGNIKVEPVNSNIPFENHKYIGWATHEILNGESGLVTISGKVRGIQTNGANYSETWAEGNMIYINCTTGTLTNVIPNAPDCWIMAGIVINVHSTNGTIEVRRQLSTKIMDASDVDGTPLNSNGQILVWDNDSGYFDPNYNINNFILDSILNPATTLEAQTGLDNTDYITSKTSKEQTDLNSVRYYGNKEDVYLNGFKLVADSAIVQSVRSWFDSLLLVGNVHVTDTLSARKLRLTDGYTDGYYLKVNSNGNIIAEAISGALVYQGVWLAATNTPTLTDGTGVNGHYYRVDTGGDSIDVNFGSGAISFFNGDDVVFNGTIWEKIPSFGYTLQAATASILGGVKIGDNINVTADGMISIDKQTLTAGSSAGQLSISEGNTVTINVNDADHSSTNELQDLTWDETTGDLVISSGTGDNLDGRYTLITDWQDSVLYFTNRLSNHSDSLIQLFTRTAEQSDSLIQLYSWNKDQSDSILQLQSENNIQSDSIQLLSDSLFYYVLTTTFEDSLLQIRGDMNSDFTTLSDSLSYFVLTTVFNDSLAIFRQDISDLQDTVSVHLDTLQSHNLRILALGNEIDQLRLDVYDSLSVHRGRISVNEGDIASIYDSLTNIYTIAQVNGLIADIDLRNNLQSDSILQNADSIDVIAAMLDSVETITELATVLEAQAGVSDKLMTALRVAEMQALNAVSYYNVKEDIYSNFDATLDSIFASNHYEFATLEPEKKETGVYRKDFETDFIEVLLNGVSQDSITHYTHNDSLVTFIKAPLIDDIVKIKYKHQDYE